MHAIILGSGSAGNATLFCNGSTRVLVDAGIGPRTLLQRLRDAGDGAPPTALVVTHAHADHVGHAERIAAKLQIPLYASEATAREMGWREVRIFSPREPFAVGALEFAPTPLPHDAAQVALVVSGGGHKFALCTDLGEVTPMLVDALRDVDVLLIEANHDEAMLAAGPYPDFLKRRIASARGHLSNRQTAGLLRALRKKPERVVLMHLSESNNAPAIARAVCADALSPRTLLEVAPPRSAMHVTSKAVRAVQYSFAF